MSSTINALSITSFTIDPSFWANAPAGQPNEKAPDTGADTLPPDGSPPPRHQYSPAPANILAQLQKQSGGAQPRQGQGADGTALEARRYGDTSVVTGPGNYLGDTQPQPAPGESDRTQAIVKKYPDGSFTRERDGQVTLFKKVPGGYNVHKPDGSIAFTENPHEQWLDGALQRNSRNGEIILARQAQQAAEQAAREQRQGLGGAVRGVNKALSNLAKTPENLYKSVRDQGLAKTIDDMAVGYLSMPFDIAHAISDKDMQTLTASALAMGLSKVPGRTATGKLGRTAAGTARALERRAGALERTAAKAETLARQPSLRMLKDLEGKTEGGPGRWVKIDRGNIMGLDYQEQITKVDRRAEYKVGGVRFDSYDPVRRVLVDAKDWKGWPPENGNATIWKKWREKTLEEATGQIKAAPNTPIEWVVATQRSANEVKLLFRDEKIKEINVRVVPKD